MKRHLPFSAFIYLICSLFLLTSDGVSEAQDQDTFAGILYVYHDEEDRLDSAELVVFSPQELVYYSILLDDDIPDTVQDLDGEEVEILGKIMERDEEQWLSVDSLFHVVYGEVTAVDDEEGELTAVRLESEDGHNCSLLLNEKSLELAKQMGGKKVRAVGSYAQSSQKALVLEDYAEYVSGRGYFEVEKTEEGDINGLRFVCRSGEHAALAVYDIKLNDEGRSLLSEYGEKQAIEIRGILQDEKSACWLKVLACEFTYGSDDYDDEEYLEESDDWDEG